MSLSDETTVAALLADARRVLRERWLIHVFYDLLFKGLAGLVLIPLSTWMFATLISITGRLTVSNTDVVGFFLSPIGLAAGIAWLTVTLAAILAGAVGHVAIAGGALLGLDVHTFGALGVVVSNATRLMRLAARVIAVVAAAAAPVLLVVIVAYRALLADFDIYYVATQRPTELWIALAIIAPFVLGLAILLAWLTVRWFLALPVFVFEGSSPRESLRKSGALMANQGRMVIATVLAWVLVGLGLPLLVAVVFAVGGGTLLGAIGDRYSVVVPATALLALAYAAALAVATLIGLVGVNATAGSLYSRCRSTHTPATVRGLTWVPAGGRRLRQWLTIGAITALLLATIQATVVAIEELEVERRIGVTAHRGSSLTAPENSLSALRAAIADGADVAEIDVQETADGAIAVLHDSDLRRIAGDPRGIWQVSSDELDSLDAGTWFGPDFAGEKIPTLQEAIGVARDRITLNIELKFNGHEEQLASRVVEIVRREGFVGQAVISSLEYPALLTVQDLAPDIPVGFIVASTVTDITRLDVDFLAINESLANRALIRTAQRDGKEIHVWTVNNRKSMWQLIELGVDNIMTDDPPLLREVLDERAELSDAEKLLLAFRNWIWSGG